MQWRLKAWASFTAYALQTDLNAKAVYSHDDPGGLLDGFEWVNAPTGDCRRLTFWGAPSDRKGVKRIDIDKRDIIRLQLREDELAAWQDVFAGVIVENPDSRDTRKGTYVAEGLRNLLRLRYMDTRRITVGQDVNEYIDDISGLIPAQISYTKPPATGGTLEEFYLPYRKLSDAVEALRQTVPSVSFDIDRSGVFKFQEPTASGNTFSYEQALPQRMQINSDEIASKVVLVVTESDRTLRTRETRVAVAVHEHAEHADWEAEAAYLSPLPIQEIAPDSNSKYVSGDQGGTGGLALHLATQCLGESPNHAANGVAFPDDNGWDDDPTSFFSPTGSWYAQLTVPSRYAIVGVRYDLELDVDFNNYMAVIKQGQATSTCFPVDFPQRVGRSRGMAWTVVEDEDVLDGTFECRLYLNGGAIYELKLLVVDRDALAKVAESLIRLPASEPQTLDIAGYFAPAVPVTITGTPGGEVTGDAAEYRYSLTIEGNARTVIDLEQRTEGDDARMIRLEAERVADRAQGSLRLHLTRV